MVRDRKGWRGKIRVVYPTLKMIEYYEMTVGVYTDGAPNKTGSIRGLLHWLKQNTH